MCSRSTVSRSTTTLFFSPQETVSARFTLLGRNPEHSIVVDVNTVSVGMGGGAPFMIDSEELAGEIEYEFAVHPFLGWRRGMFRTRV
jgi:hypothetical protein